MFLVRTPGARGEPMFAGGHFFSVFAAGLVGGCPGWPISSDTDPWNRRWSTPGNEGWSGREGQPPGSSGTMVRLTPAGEMADRREASRHGSCRWGMGLDPVGFRAHKLFRHWEAVPWMLLVARITGPGQGGAGRQESDCAGPSVQDG